MTTPTDTISPAHKQLLENSAILPAFAAEAGAQTVTEREDLPEEMQWAFDKRGPGILFWHTDRKGNSIPQFAPDKRSEDAPKYIQAPG